MIHKYLPRIEFDSYDDFINNYKLNIPENFNFGFDIVDGWANDNPDKPAMVWCNPEGEERRFSFGELKKLTNKAANFFLSTGIKKGDSVMLILKRRYECWICMVALHKIGAICIPASIQLTTKDIVYRSNAASVKMIVSVKEEDIIKQIEGAIPDSPTIVSKAFVGTGVDANEGCVDSNNGCVDFKEGWVDFNIEYDKCSEVFDRPTGNDATQNTDIMLMYFTSGTTGMPKMVKHDYTYPLGHITTAKYWQQVEDGGLHLTVADSGWAKFGWGKIYGQWICGAVQFVYDMEKFIPDDLMRIMEKYKLTTFCAPPTIYRFLIKEDLSKYDFSSLHHCSTAGEPLNPEVFNQFYQATGLKIMEGFGQTESTVLLATFKWLEPKLGSMGKPAPLYNMSIVDENGNDVEEGIEGNIVIRCNAEDKPAGLFGGYYRDEELTNKVWHDGFYNTGDVAWRDGDGFYWFIGRSDDVIKCSGYRIGPFEVESALLEHPSVLECAITAAPDPIRGQVVKATVVLAKTFKPSDELIKELQNHVKHVTAPYKYPRIVEFVDELPKTVGGKIRRGQIREEDMKK
jgi:acetyl-CoA synthetase